LAQELQKGKEKVMEAKQKYFFITYQARNKHNDKVIWNGVIDQSPMEFIIEVQEIEERGSGQYNDFVILNALKISKAEYEKYKDEF
jgi:hypothetical protein